MRSLISLNDNWIFHVSREPSLRKQLGTGNAVSLPHNAVELPFSYFDETIYQREFTYQRVLKKVPEWEGQEISLLFDGAMANAHVYLNGDLVVAHPDGYTPFEARLTGKLRDGDNLITVVIDGSENPAIPPFGGQIDYLTYAGIYRDAWIKITAPVSIAMVKIETPDALGTSKSVQARVMLANPMDLPISGELTAMMIDADDVVLAKSVTKVNGVECKLAFDGLQDIRLWDIDSPNLYRLEVTIETENGQDNLTTQFGFRTAEFTPDGFYLNGRSLKIRGLNRHQSFPYVGYALGRAAQERDAEILKHVLHVNLVRTSHYPQSSWFLDACDRLGLLVFEEIPGWQHIGDADWKATSIQNVRSMITRDWNHPSIVIWGVRINESQDDQDFYTETNRLARELDPTRQTGGVRCIDNSTLLEDVYTMNDFFDGNENPGQNRLRPALRSVEEVTGLKHPIPYLVTEFGGHMHPVKSFDHEQRQIEHVRRYLEVLNQSYAESSISGTIGWCAFDYNTHKDFGSGDRICYHGVMDMFREPKFAAYVYASQCDTDKAIVLEPVTFWARGERNIGGILPLIVLTNCDEVEMRYGESVVIRLGPDRVRYPDLPHAPVIFEMQHFDSLGLGAWGMEWKHGSIVGLIDGKVVSRRDFVPDPVPTTLEVAPDRDRLASRGNDTVRVIVRALDQVGNKLPFLMDSVKIELSGPARLLGPDIVPLRGGSTGFWVQTTGGIGDVVLRVSCAAFGTTTRTLTAQ